MAEWGWSKETTFTDFDAEEFLRELMIYVMHKRPVGWEVFPVYMRVLEPEPCSVVRLEILNDEFEVVWRMSYTPLNIVLMQSQYLHHLVIQFSGLKAVVTHMTCCDDGGGFYFVRAGDLVTRCASVRECMGLFNAMSTRLDDLARFRQDNNNARQLYRYLSGLRCSDAVRQAYVCRKMQILKTDAANMRMTLL
jgi:hypothetical protein